MEKFLNELLERSLKDKNSLRSLKNTAIRCDMYEFAAKLRDMERELFPETEKYIKAKEIDQQIRGGLKMVGVDAKEGGGWIVHELTLMMKKQ